MEDKAHKIPYVTLNNGMKMPQVGLGTFDVKHEDLIEIVKEAVTVHGVRLIDTASLYKNEKPIGEALHHLISTGVVKREDLFIVTKLWIDEKSDAEAALKRSLANL